MRSAATGLRALPAHAPPDAPLLPHALLEQRLRVHLTPALEKAVEAGLAALRRPPARVMRAERGTLPPVDSLAVLRRALARQDAVTLSYDTGGQGALSTRTVRPLALEQRDEP